MDNETRELLTWYVNGTLTGADRDKVEAALQNEAGASALLAWERGVQAAVRSDPALEIAADRGLHQTMLRIRAEAKAVAAPRRGTWGEWIARLGAKVQWSPALAVACGVVAVQFAVIAHMSPVRSGAGEFAGVRAMNGRAQAAAIFVRIAFKPDVQGRDLNDLLRRTQADIVSGPSQLGDYYLLVNGQGALATLRELQSSEYVESAEIVNALPARP